jgi:glyoxylase-like metal-dependent hydrolase (beta-lactamase superfamily II)
VLERELIAATGKPVPGRGLLERSRYHGALWAHGPRWCPSPPSRGEAWNGMPAVRELPGLPPEILLVPTPGHTRGHSAVAVLGKRADTPVGSPSGWSLHCGDAYFHRGDVGKAPATPLGLRAFQGLVQMNRTERLASRQKLRALVAAQPDVRVFCAHDPEELP